MILIISTDIDHSTSEVIRWLSALNKKFIRLSENTEINILKLNDKDLIFEVNNKIINFKEIDSVWYRRGSISLQNYPLTFLEPKILGVGDIVDLLTKYTGIKKIIEFIKKDCGCEDRREKLNKKFGLKLIWNKEKQYENQIKKELFLYNNRENNGLGFHLHNIFKRKKYISNFNNVNVNKLDILYYCKQKGLLHTPFIVTQSKKEALEFFEINREIISKGISFPFSHRMESISYMSYSHKVSKQEIENLPEIFVPTFFQAYIKKKYEIRSFFLNGTSYSMAIFSQNNEKTQIDFRHYDDVKSNRLTPFKLPNLLQDRILELLYHFDLNTASIDIIYTEDGGYELIDVNPVGQFGMVSKPCNYYLEKIIAETL